MIRKGLLFAIVGLLLMVGCVTAPVDTDTPTIPETPDEEVDNPRVAYLPDGRMVLLQSSGEDKLVEFTDANLEAVIRDKLELEATILVGDPIYSNDLETITSLHANGQGITDLAGIENCINLQFVDLRWNNVSDVSPLAKLTGITVISQDEGGNETAGYTYLRLELDWNQVKDVTPLSNLSGIDYLNIDLSGNGISDVTLLSSLSGLRHLYLQYNDIRDVSALGELSNLTILALGENHIEDVSALAQCSLLTSLSLWNNEITNISPLTELENLTQLTLDGNLISELPSLLGKWQQMHILVLSSNQIKDASAVKDLPETCEVVLVGNPLE